MSKRGQVADFAGNEMYPGDLVVYAARTGNRVKMTDAIVLDVTAKNVKVPGVGNMLVPVLRVQPTGAESGFTRRRTARAEYISAEHVRLVTPNFADDAA